MILFSVYKYYFLIVLIFFSNYLSSMGADVAQIESVQSLGIICPICLSSMTNLKKPVSLLPCVCPGLFHNPCILAWFEKQKTCPSCAHAINVQAVVTYDAKTFRRLCDKIQEASMEKNEDLPEYLSTLTLSQLKILSDAGNIQATISLAKKYTDLKEYETSFKLLDSVRLTRHPQVLLLLGIYYNKGLGVAKDLLKACEFFKQAADLNNYYAYFNLGYCYQYGYGVEKNVVQAIKYFEESITMADLVYAKYSLAILYLEEPAYRSKRDVAYGLLRSAEKRGFLQAKKKLEELNREDSCILQ